jgi:amino acid permease
MKTNITKFIIISTIFLLPFISLAALVECADPDNCNYLDLLKTVDNVFRFILFTVAIPLAAVVITIAGVYMVIYSSNDSKRTEAKKMLQTTVIGLALALASYLIIKAIVLALAGDNEPGRILQDYVN